MWLWLEPLDVLMFRDSRPFAGGETHRARSIFPPSPLTFQGALRTKLLAHMLSQHNLTLSDFARFLRAEQKPSESLEGIVSVLGDANHFGKFRMTGPFVARKGSQDPEPELFFPIPFDLLGVEAGVVSLSPLSETAPVKWDAEWKEALKPLWPGPGQAKLQELSGFWLTSQGLQKYLQGETNGVHPVAAADVYVREQRVGIQLQRGRRAVVTGMLYTADFIRLQKDHGFVVKVELEGDDMHLDPLREPGLLSLGGEGRACMYEELKCDPLERLQAAKDHDRQAAFKLYLATPAIFQQGWLPDFLDPNTLQGSIESLEVQLVAAAVGKPWPIGGWDLAHNKPKDLYYAVPPGSVYFFEVKNGDAFKVAELFHGKTRLQELGNRGNSWLTELAHVGFGLTFVGRWDYCRLSKGVSDV